MLYNLQICRFCKQHPGQQNFSYVRMASLLLKTKPTSPGLPLHVRMSSIVQRTTCNICTFASRLMLDIERFTPCALTQPFLACKTSTSKENKVQSKTNAQSRVCVAPKRQVSFFHKLSRPRQPKSPTSRPAKRRQGRHALQMESRFKIQGASGSVGLRSTQYRPWRADSGRVSSCLLCARACCVCPCSHVINVPWLMLQST